MKSFITLRVVFILLVGFTTQFVASCSEDDEVTQADQNALDDQAIANVLEDYYFNPVNGTLDAFDEDDSSDDAYPSLASVAVQDPSGFWYAHNPNVMAEGEQLTSNSTDSILLSYDMRQFRASNDNSNLYGSLLSFRSTINSSGLPEWDPNFYYSGLTDDQITDTNRPEFYEIEGFVEAIKNFKAANTTVEGDFHFQGVIIIPSRLGFARDVNLLSVTRDVSFVIAFEIHRSLPRNN